MRRSAFLVWVATWSTACFSPNVTPDGDPDGSSGSSGGSSSTATGPDPTTTTTAPPTTSATSAAESSSTGSDDTTSSESGAAETTSTSGPPDPYCGDGDIDRDEECDDGDENANTAACREDCTMAACGDGNIWDGVEACDDGMGGNELEVGACAPDCSRVIEEREITGGEFIGGDGNLGGNPVGFVDGTCPVGYAALFVVPGVRQASATPYAGDGQIDWVLEPYTAYVNSEGELLWITDDVALLGVRNGGAQPLLTSIFEIDFDSRAISGLNTNWTNALSNTCNGWTSGQGLTRFGDATSTTTYIYTDTAECDGWPEPGGGIFVNLTYVYCVEQ